MSIEYLGLSNINGPLIVLEGVQDAFYDEIVEFVVNGKEKKLGRIIEVYEDKAVIQVFEGTENMSLTNTHTKLTGHPMEIALSADMLGRTFNGIGQPIDDLGPITSTLKRDVNGLPLNPVTREYPRNYIRTGISAIDGLTTLIRGQKLPIFSETVCRMTSLPRRLSNRLHSEMIPMNNSRLYLPPWASNMTLPTSSAAHLKRAELPTM